MKRSPTPVGVDLLIVMGLALLAILGLVLPIPDMVRAVVVAPLVLALPGYAVAAAIFRPGEIDLGQRIVLIVVFSMSVLALGGLVLQTVIALDSTVYVVLLIVTTVGCLAVAQRRRVTGFPSTVRPSRLPRPGYTSMVAFVVAIAIAGWAIAIATAGQNRQLDREHFTALWMLPSGTGDEFEARIGVANHEGKPLKLLLSASQGGRALRRWHLNLEPDREWSAVLASTTITGKAPVVATLYREGRVYRRVALNVGAAL
jgi:hypothetical protein